jgi:hypothetical protein
MRRPRVRGRVGLAAAAAAASAAGGGPGEGLGGRTGVPTRPRAVDLFTPWTRMTRPSVRGRLAIFRHSGMIHEERDTPERARAPRNLSTRPRGS